MKSMRLTLGDRLWQLRDEIADLRKERKKLMMCQPFEQEDWDELAIIDARLDELAMLHGECERALKTTSLPVGE